MIIKNCTTIIAGKKATFDGSVMIGHNEDLGGESAQIYAAFPGRKDGEDRFIKTWFGAKIPAAGKTYGFIATKMFDESYIPGDITTGMNEHQVAVVNNIAYQREIINPWPEKDRIIWTEYIKFALERAGTAREAVLVIGNLAHKYKHWGPGCIFGIADPDEGWWLEITQEGQWAAERIPDNKIDFRANIYQIGRITFKDNKNFLYSNDVESYAVDRGWYDPAEGPFHFANVYGDSGKKTALENTRRHWIFAKLIKNYMPQLKIRDLMVILRDHYEGTSYDLSNNYKLSSPHSTGERTICDSTTEISTILQMRDWLPPEIGGVSWRALGPPCISIFIPWYLGSKKIPDIYKNADQKESAYGIFRDLFAKIEANYSENIQRLKDIWMNLEDMELLLQETIEEAAYRLYKQDIKLTEELLSNYTYQISMKIIKTAARYKLKPGL